MVGFAFLQPAHRLPLSGSALPWALCAPAQDGIGPVATGGTFRQSLRLLRGDCLKLRKINHLQRTTGVTHYKALPRPVARF